MSKQNSFLKTLILVAVVILGLVLLYFLNCFATGGRGRLRPLEQYKDYDVDASIAKNNCDKPYNCPSIPPPEPSCNDYSDKGPAPTCPQERKSSCEPDGNFPGQDLPACFPSSQLTPDELLPNDECNLWSKNNPQGSPDLSNRNFLQAGWATGVSTVGSTMRNANLQLRSDPPNPQKVVSPWMQTTIGPDLARKPLELGTCA